MADHAVEEDDGELFTYRRGRRARWNVAHARIDESVDEIEDSTFYNCERLLTVNTHDGIRRVEKWAFGGCVSLRRINLKYAVEIDEYAFDDCKNLESVEFGDRLETIGNGAFSGCNFLPHLKLPSIITIGASAFSNCKRLTDVELSEQLESIGTSAFWKCERLRCIALPLKRDMFEFNQYMQKYNQFEHCERLTTVDLVGQAHTLTVASLHMESWRSEMKEEINRINQVLPNTLADEKTNEIQRWMDSVMDKMDHYKAEHFSYVKEGITLLELALWKAKLGEKEDNSEERKTKKDKVDAESTRKQRRITCGADTVIKNVLPFLQVSSW